jgi:transposase
VWTVSYAPAALEDRKKETISASLKSIPEDLRATVEEVCADLYEGFINAAEEVLPRAKVIGDRFQAPKLYRAAFDDLRKIEFQRLGRARPLL